MEQARAAFLLRRLHSLSGTLPIGGFLILHLWTNMSALAGSTAYAHAVDKIQALPGLWALEVFGIYLPLAFHALYGFKIAAQGSSNVGHYPYAKNWLYITQRASGLVAFVFIAYHLWEYRVQKWLFDLHPHSFFDALAGSMSSVVAVKVGPIEPAMPHMALFYSLGILACVFHFANGLVGFAISWGLVASRRAIKLVGAAAFAVGTALFAMGFVTVVYLATGSFALPEDRSNLAPCPEPVRGGPPK